MIKKYKGNGVAGLDISGDFVDGNGEEIFTEIIDAGKKGIPVTLHIGESPKESAGQQMKELLLVKPKRVGHGVFLCDEAMKWVKENNVLVELCLTSAHKVKMIKHPKMHPALKLLEQGHPVVIFTDDPLVFDCSLSQECASVAQLLGLNAEKSEII